MLVKPRFSQHNIFAFFGMELAATTVAHIMLLLTPEQLLALGIAPITWTLIEARYLKFLPWKEVAALGRWKTVTKTQRDVDAAFEAITPHIPLFVFADMPPEALGQHRLNYGIRRGLMKVLSKQLLQHGELPENETLYQLVQRAYREPRPTEDQYH